MTKRQQIPTHKFLISHIIFNCPENISGLLRREINDFFKLKMPVYQISRLLFKQLRSPQ
jgi:hypothetical protein